MRQLVLNIQPDTPPTLDNFVAGDNAELLAALKALAEDVSALPAKHLYLWGAPGSGRSHLLHATATQAASAGRTARYLAAQDITDALPDTPGALLAVDDVDRLSANAQIALFNAFNRAANNGQTLLLAGSAAPRGLALREDLRTRIGQMLPFEVRELNDEARAAILVALAERRGVALADGLIDFLLRHARRDIPSLLGIFNALDAASLEHKRPITLPLLRELMQQGLEI